MKSLTLIFAAFFFVTFNVHAQAWRNTQGFTPGAKIALHRVWGADMGYSLEHTAHIADSIFRHGTYINKRTMNSGVSSDGTINPLTARVFSVTYLGTTDATLLGGPDGYTAKLFLKQDCGNLDWTFVPPTPEPPARIIRRETVIQRDTVQETIVVRPMTIKLTLCTASYVNGHFQQRFTHGTKEFTLTQAPHTGDLIDGYAFVSTIPHQVRACDPAVTLTDFFWMTSN